MRELTIRSKQKGAALFLSLVVMLLMTGIILHGARASLLDAKIANNGQHAVRALMAAEDSALAGELIIEANFSGAPVNDISADGNVSINALGKIDVAAKQDVAVTGLNVSNEAQVGFIGKGNASAELSASGQTTVKGAMVMIN